MSGDASWEGSTMNIEQQLKSIYTGFTVEYGTQLPHEIASKEAGPELLISYRNQFGKGELIVRKATAEDASDPEVETGMWVILVDHERGATFAPLAGAFSEDEIIADLVKLANEKIGPSTGAESAEVVG